MTKTLVLGYTPREGSYTKILKDEFIKQASGRTTLEEVDLAMTPPDLLLFGNLNLMMEWNKGKREFNGQERLLLANHQQFIDQLLEADYVVLAFPIYNFTMPATVKAWMDAIVVSGKTFSFDSEKGFIGLCKDKKALSIIVGGFEYGKESVVKEFASPTIKQNYDFIGMNSEFITAFGVDQYRDRLNDILDRAKSEIKSLVDDWYSA